MAVLAGVLTQADLPAFTLLCNSLDLEQRMREQLQADGATIRGVEGGLKGHPAARIAAEARSTAVALLREFGLTPLARQRVDQAPAPPDPKGPWATMRRMQGKV